jgi:TRAP-type C4-dicarboxylate transport system permease small subunit
MITRLNKWITECLLVIAAILAFALSFVIVADVIGRVAFNSPLKGTPEMVSSALVIILFLQAGYAVRSGGMINVNFLLVFMPQRFQRYVMGTGALLGMAFFAFVSFGAIEPAIYSWTSNEYEGEGALRVPSWPARFIVVLGAGLAAVSYLLVAVDHFRGAAESRGS